MKLSQFYKPCYYRLFKQLPLLIVVSYLQDNIFSFIFKDLSSSQNCPKQKNLNNIINACNFVSRVITQCHDQASRFVYILTRGASDSLGPEELAPLVQDVVDTHPGLSFLKEATEFHSRYVHTVGTRNCILYCRRWLDDILYKRDDSIINSVILEQKT